MRKQEKKESPPRNEEEEVCTKIFSYKRILILSNFSRTDPAEGGRKGRSEIKSRRFFELSKIKKFRIFLFQGKTERFWVVFSRVREREKRLKPSKMEENKIFLYLLLF